MTRVFVHPLAGVLSAYGMGLADQNVIREQAVELPLVADSLATIGQALDQLAETAAQELQRQQVSRGVALVHRRVHVRYEGSDSALVVPHGDIAQILAAFENAYRQRFAFLMQGKRLIVEAVSVEAVVPGDAPVEPRQPLHEPREVPRRETVRMYGEGRWLDAALVVREDMRPGDRVPGPAIIAEKNATTVVEPGWEAELTGLDHLVLVRTGTRVVASRCRHPGRSGAAGGVQQPVHEHRGADGPAAAEHRLLGQHQGALDFSCALFDAEGNLIANAPHMPVHLGSMGESIKTVIRENAGRMQPGDVYVLNDPYHGGTHLPDVTVITPVYLPDHAQPMFYVGSRGHHADIGGTTPGSMPPFSTRIEEEGVQIDNVKLVDRGVLAGRGHPRLAGFRCLSFSRNPQQNLADLKAQIAANEKGVQELRAWWTSTASTWSRPTCVTCRTTPKNRCAGSSPASRTVQFTLPLDNGAQIRVAIRVDASSRSATIDFTGTSPQQTNNFNAPTAVCMAAVLYVFRSLVDDDIPLNAGCLKPLKVIIPPGSMLNPNPPASVVAGNVETSTCITNALLGALGVMAGSQPTMNNFTFGNARHQYYETISGGSGAGGTFDVHGALVGGFDGTSVVQTHMTNSRLTDPEVLEFRFPVRLESYEIRKGSGGAGRFRGGDGGVRRVRFLEPMTASILSNGRVHPAFGMAGGQPGASGINRVVRANGQTEELAHIGQAEMQAGDIFEIHTPGGGGFGMPE
jgi:5-oxoprolinase (ATP-hydrolysing)